MGLATITCNPHSQKEHTKIHNSPSLVLIRLVLTDIRPFKNVKINKEMYGHPDTVRTQCPDLNFVNFDIFKWLYLAHYWVYLHQTCKAWSACYDYVDPSIVAYPIILQTCT